jgi:glucose/arabinose dehydrogenase
MDSVFAARINSSQDAPFAPAGVVVRDNIAFVADTGEGSAAGRIAKYNTTTGAFLGKLVPKNFTGEFRPRGLVFGPDGGLYVSVSSIAETDNVDPPGYILRFDVATDTDSVIAWNDGDQVLEENQGEAINLHNPVGLVFSPNGMLYVTSNRKEADTSIDSNTLIVVIDPTSGKELRHIELDPHSVKFPTRLFAQAMVFGPEGKLFIPVVVESLFDGTGSGAILTYDPATQQTQTFFASSPFEQSIVAPSYATFGYTDPATLAYAPPILDDYLFVGDQGDSNNPADDRVQQIDLRTGSLHASFATPGQITGPRGLVFNDGKLLVVNQNVDQPKNGAILQFASPSGASLSPLISSNDPKAPFAPRGLVVKDNVLYVADSEGASGWGAAYPPILKFDATSGDFLGEIVPNACFTSEIHPRSLVFGPDGHLYASYFSTAEFNSADPPGLVLKFLDTSTGAFEVVAANYGPSVTAAGEVSNLHNPEGLAFAPDGRLYVTSSRTDSADNGIVVVDVGTKRQVGFIPLGQAFAQALLFGPRGNLYVPITGGGNAAGSIRVYDTSTGNFSLLVEPLSSTLKQPWYLTFSKTEPATLVYTF